MYPSAALHFIILRVNANVSAGVWALHPVHQAPSEKVKWHLVRIYIHWMSQKPFAKRNVVVVTKYTHQILPIFVLHFMIYSSPHPTKFVYTYVDDILNVVFWDEPLLFVYGRMWVETLPEDICVSWRYLIPSLVNKDLEHTWL